MVPETSNNEIGAKMIQTGKELFTLIKQAESAISLAQILPTP
jgi:hypothetical protein